MNNYCLAKSCGSAIECKCQGRLHNGKKVQRNTKVTGYKRYKMQMEWQRSATYKNPAKMFIKHEHYLVFFWKNFRGANQCFQNWEGRGVDVVWS